MNEKLILNIYHSLVYSHLSYCVEAWGSADPTFLNKIKVLQNKAVRIMSGKQYFQIYGQTPGPLPSSEPLYKNLKILKFQDIFRLNIAKFVYSTLDFVSPQIFHDWFIFDYEVHNHSTRASSELTQNSYFDCGQIERSLSLHNKGSNNKYGGKMIQVSGPLIWNNVPDHIQKATSIHTFKHQLKRHLIEQYDLDQQS